jgi:hypothetical protein
MNESISGSVNHIAVCLCVISGSVNHIAECLCVCGGLAPRSAILLLLII